VVKFSKLHIFDLGLTWLVFSHFEFEFLSFFFWPFNCQRLF